MATYIRGNDVANATNYVLYEIENGTDVSSMGCGSQDYNNTTVDNASGGTTLTGYLFSLGKVPANKPLAGIRVAVGMANANVPTKISGYLYTCEIPPNGVTKGSFIEKCEAVRVKAVTQDISQTINGTAFIDIIFDEPYINSNNKFL